MQFITFAQFTDFTFRYTRFFTNRASAKPFLYNKCQYSKLRTIMPLSVTLFFNLTSSSCIKNHWSIFVKLNIPFTDMPARNESAIYQIQPMIAVMNSRRHAQCSQNIEVYLRIETRWCPLPSPRKVFCNDFCYVHPIAITSLTDFICVVRRS